MSHIIAQLSGFVHLGGQKVCQSGIRELLLDGFNDRIPSVAEGGHITISQPRQSCQVDDCEHEVVVPVGLKEFVDHE
jgi:hypothetical protein